MTANRFFIPRRDISGRRGILRGAEHHHLSRVVRLRPGEDVGLFDEAGVLYSARVVHVGAEETELLLSSAGEAAAGPVRITLGQAVLKAKAMDTVVQKAAELGLYAIAPFISRRSVVRPTDRSPQRTERWSKIALAAAKQSRSGRVPRILVVSGLEDLSAAERGGVKLFLSERGGVLLRDILSGPPEARPSEVLLLIGPEGGWEDGEEERLRAAGFRAVSLGGTILRAETAALAAAAIVSHYWNW